jgi:hypothetical protein
MTTDTILYTHHDMIRYTAGEMRECFTADERRALRAGQVIRKRTTTWVSATALAQRALALEAGKDLTV